MTEAEFPVESLREAAPHLRRPFTVPAVKFRILEGKGEGDKARAMCAAYIDARLVSERLNLVCPQLWSHSFEAVQGGLQCNLTVDGLTRPDVGWSKGTGTDMDLKALRSDALKRAAVHFGVGVSLYALPSLTLFAKAGHIRVWQREGKSPAYYLQPTGESELRSRYAKWLESHGAKAFGEPLDHGDVDHGEPHEPEPVSDVTPAVPLVDPDPGSRKAPEAPKPIGDQAAAEIILNSDGAGIPRDDLRRAVWYAAGQPSAGSLSDAGAFEDDQLAIDWISQFDAGQRKRVDDWLDKRRAKMADEAKGATA